MLKLVQFKDLSDLNFDVNAMTNIAQYIVGAINEGHVIYLNDLSGYGKRTFFVAG